MELSNLTAVSPVDGRYRNLTADLDQYFSEFALIKYRVQVEVEYFIALCELPLRQLGDFKPTDFELLRGIYRIFSLADAQKIKETEKVTNHDVKAVEYYLKSRLDDLKLGRYREFIHFGLTSQDINNTAVPLTLKLAVNDIYLPLLDKITDRLTELAEEWKNIPMLARTHGQPASPTRLGKEIMVFVERINNQVKQLTSIPFSAKFGGATGNFNAHAAAYPGTDWVEFANHFVNDVLGLNRLQTTTQIEHYDNMGALFDCMKRINTILIDLDRDFWTYISMEYFKQKIKEGEVGSSVMPHKVNPIDFENSEGNLAIANAVFEFLSAKLPISRLQRDLTDSTVLRNIGVPLAHTVIALKALLRGLEKIVLNRQALDNDLEANWIVISEAMQTILRREGYANPYEVLKDLTRNNKTLTKEDLHLFIDSLKIGDNVKQELKALSPYNYTGI
ncbi:MAG TPA: adenylosuccinate lyase [Bacteroidales bacterium]|jgi:adenylosuccinate lyase|nr:adenylosuccinate lyase [Bacteroidales bacterium]